MRNRSVIEIVMLMFTGIVGLTVVGLGVVIGVIEIRDPEADTSRAVSILSYLISSILGALFGMLASGSRHLDR